MGFSAEIDGKFAGCGLDDFLLRGAGFDGDMKNTHTTIISRLYSGMGIVDAMQVS